MLIKADLADHVCKKKTDSVISPTALSSRKKHKNIFATSQKFRSLRTLNNSILNYTAFHVFAVNGYSYFKALTQKRPLTFF